MNPILGFLEYRIARNGSRPWNQPFWEWLNRISRAGMNVGHGDNVHTSGETWIIHHLLSKAPPGSLVIDAGANKGEWSKLARKYRVEIFAFEPSKHLSQLLAINVYKDSELPFLKGFHTVPLALSDTTKANVILFSDHPEDGCASLSSRSRALSPRYETEVVHTTALDEFWEKASHAEWGTDAYADIYFLKMDIEGSEIAALRGASKLLQLRKIRHIQFEIGPSNIATGTYFADIWKLLSPTHDIYRILHKGLRHISSYDTGIEDFHVTNYLATLREGSDAK